MIQMIMMLIITIIKMPLSSFKNFNVSHLLFKQLKVINMKLEILAVVVRQGT
jgi:hypothetical protein